VPLPAAHRMRRTVVVAIALLGASATAVPIAEAQPAAATTQVRQDFNGDGYEDLAVAAPYATVGGKAQAGYVAVLYGSASGLGPAAKKVYSQASAGVPGTVEADDRFGSELVVADVDGDGFTDLVVQAGNEQWEQGGIARTGNRTVLWGGSGGFTSGKVLPAYGTRVHQGGGLSVTGDFNGDGHQDLAQPGLVRFGPIGRDGVAADIRTFQDEPTGGDLQVTALAAGDTDGDGITDLVVNARAYDSDDAGDHGDTLYHLRGSHDGPQPLTTVKDAQGERIRPGYSLALGDVNGDHRADIVMGGTSLRFVLGTENGPANAVAPQVITQDTPGVPGVQEPEDIFGFDLSVGDVNGDGYGDVLAGNPHEAFDGLKQAGTFAVVPGGPDGPTGAGTKVFSQNSADVPGTAEQNDFFGGRTALVDTNRDGRAELFVGSPGENANDGGVWAFRNPGTGPTATGSISFGAGTLGTDPNDGSLGSRFAR
jgi:hypothetical protein